MRLPLKVDSILWELEDQLPALTYQIQSLTPRACVFVLYYSLATTNSILEIRWFVRQLQECQTAGAILWLVLHIVNIFYYSTFCYFLYVKRKLLEGECNSLIECIQNKAGDIRGCAFKVMYFFREYMQLRRLMFAWLNAAVFTNAFGITLFLTWRLRVPVTTFTSNATTTQPFDSGGMGSQDHGNFCNRRCTEDSMQYAHLSSHFIIQVMSEIFMIMIFAVIAVGGLDLKYQWDRFKKMMYLDVFTHQPAS